MKNHFNRQNTSWRLCVTVRLLHIKLRKRQPQLLAAEQILQGLLYRYSNIVAKDFILPVVVIVVVSDNQLIGIHSCCD
jgi:hypothetical protein